MHRHRAMEDQLRALNEALRESLRKNPNACECCRKVFLEPGAILRHLESPQHAQKLVAHQKAQAKSPSPSEPKSLGHRKTVSRLSKECTLCNITNFKNSEAAYNHYISAEHTEREKQLAVGGPPPEAMDKPGTSSDKQQADPWP